MVLVGKCASPEMRIICPVSARKSESPFVPKQKVFMETLDGINKRLGRGKLRLAAEGYNKDWTTEFESRSRNYTTSFDELPLVKAV